MFYNPGYTGIKANLNFVGDLRYYGENDYISHFLADGRLGRFDSIRQLNPSTGIHYRNDVIGPIIQQYYGIRLANSFKLKKGHKLSAGLLYDYVKTDIQKSQFRTPDGLVGSNIQDPTIVATKESSHSHVLGLGVYFESKRKKLNGGISLDYKGVFNSDKDPGKDFGRKSDLLHTNASVGATIKAGSYIRIIPLVFARTNYSTTTVRISAKIFFKDWVYIGSAWAFQEHYSLMAGARFGWKKIGKFELGFASHYPKSISFFEYAHYAYINYFFRSKNNFESVNYN